MVLLATSLTGCAQKGNDNANEKSFSWCIVAGFALVGADMYCLGYARGIQK